jgi:DNA-binding transcriptional regulator LsrR (DeoR family)
VEIANKLGISRFKVARLLDLARREGIVKIELNPPLDISTEFGGALEESFAIEEAWVLNAEGASDDELRAQLGRLAALMLVDLIEPGDVLGVSWGRTMRAVADALPPLPPCTVVQLAGGLPTEAGDGSSELVRLVGQRTEGHVYQLHAPLFVSSAAVAKRLRAEPQIARTLTMFTNLTKVIFGLGRWSRRSSVASVLTSEDLTDLEHDPPVAEICGMFVRGDGTVLGAPLNRRAIAISAKEVRAVPEVIAVAGGPDKADAIRAVLASGLCSRIVTDRRVAEIILAEAD